ncbi:uncharacterized protein LOC101894107 [Musca domestica]|uniref:Uncharacterized protein LOC101894107 n=2 Tax=Musca domestica TaxID=7370 RepID=A0A1I8MS11_MUSDO|nr:uncharacterized protein LOC101894107 [Musca domestica]
MAAHLKILLSSTLLFVALVYSYDPVTVAPPPPTTASDCNLKSATISPEIINELKDFEHLIPPAIVDAIVAKHYVIDGGFRTALKYLRSNDFTRLQKQLLDVPEIISVLDFLHLTINATMIMDCATKEATKQMPETSALQDDEMATAASSSTLNDNGMDRMPTNTVTTTTGTTDNVPATSPKAAMHARIRKVLAYKRPQLDALEYTDDVSSSNGGGNAVLASAEQQPLVDIVLLDSKLNTLRANDDQLNTVDGSAQGTMASGHHQQHRYQQHPLGSFTSFVEEIIRELPRPAYQHMIMDKYMKNANFANFYKALRSAEFKPLVEEALKSANIQQIVKLLSSHSIDVQALKPVAFEVISWGPAV